MRVSFIDDEPEIFPMQYGGKARTIMTLAQTLLELEGVDDVRVLSRSINDPRDEFEVNGISMRRLDGYNMVGQIASEVDESDVVSVHTCSFTLPRFVNPKAALVYNLHDVMLTTAEKGSHLDKALARDWDAIIAPSEFAASVYNNFESITGAHTDVAIIPRGVDNDMFEQIAKNEAINQLQEWGITIDHNSGPVVFVPNRVNAGKGEMYLKDVCASLSKQYAEFTVLTTFEPQDKNDMPPNVMCVGWLATNKLKYFYSASDITLCLSTLPESFSQVCTESIACGTPVLSFEFGNLSSFASKLPAVNGCEPTPDAITDGLRSIIDNPGVTKTNIQLSQEIVARDYNSQTIANEYYSLYKRLIIARRQGARGQAQAVYFISPFVATHGNTLYLGSDSGLEIKSYEATKEEVLVIEACKRASTPEQLSLTTGYRDETIASIIGKLVKKGYVIEGQYGSK